MSMNPFKGYNGQSFYHYRDNPRYPDKGRKIPQTSCDFELFLPLFCKLTEKKVLRRMVPYRLNQRLERRRQHATTHV